MMLHEEIEVKLRDEILNMEFKAGEKLVEMELADRYKVSRPIIREVLRRLNSVGLVSYIPNRGHYVAKVSIKQLKEIYDLLKLLEGYACENAVNLYTQEDLDYLMDINEKMKVAASKDDHRTYRKFNDLFHEKFINICNNETLKTTISNLRVRAYAYRYLALTVPTTMSNFNEQHSNIIKLLKQKDGEKINQEMQKHIASSQRLMIEVIERSQFF